MGGTSDIDFMFEMAFNKKLPSFYSHVKNQTDNCYLLKEKNDKLLNSVDTIYTIFDIPTHLKVSKKKLNPSIGIKSVIQHKGYYIDLNRYENIELYLKDQFGKASRQALRSGKKRLETCFDISYKIYYGSIDKKAYNQLFVQFFEMLKLRAVEKRIKNKNLKHWNLYTNKVYDMILNKEASLFVIYDGVTPINISLNMHIKDVVFLFIATYDIDYSKFRIGHTNWIWMLNWFLKNNIKLVDFSKGNTAYKKRWANKDYNFEYHIFYDTTKVLTKLKATLLEKKFRLLQSLRNNNINDYYYKAATKISLTKKYQHQKKYTLTKIEQLPEVSISKIDLQHCEYCSFLKPIVYQYLYHTSTNIKKIRLYSSSEFNNIYFIKSESGNFKLIVDFNS